ncbi:MAG: aspartyl protease family protein [bacterium]|nr:aspartyl protease family protein [bacterium]
MTADPLCPIVPTLVSALFDGAPRHEFSGLIDTGSPKTFVPNRIVDDFGLNVGMRKGTVLVTGIGRGDAHAGLATLTLAVPPFGAQALEVGVLAKQWDQFDLIVGMDYLRHFEVAFRYGTFGQI